MTIFRSAALCLCIAALAACTSAPKKPPGDPVAAREKAALDRLNLRDRYSGTVLGWDVKGNTFLLYVDANSIESMDVPKEDVMIDQWLAQWKSVWRASHPHGHATLRMSVRDYYGNVLFDRTVAA